MRATTTIHQVATAAGVSVGTVSNVLNRPELVAEPTRRRVEAAVADLGYVPNGSARTLRSGKSTMIGLLVLDVTNPFFTEVARGVEDCANEAGYAVVLCNSDDDAGKEQRYLRMLEEQRARAVIVTPVMHDLRPLVELQERGLSVVLLDTEGPQELSSAAVDDVHGGRLVGEHLLGLGHRRIGFVTGPLSIPQCAARRKGLRAAVAAAGLDPDAVLREVRVDRLDADAGEAALPQLLKGRHVPTAVFCSNDLLALGVLRGCPGRGVAVPDDLALVGYDDVEFAAVLQVPLTTVHQPKYDLGCAAVELLLREDRAGEAGGGERRVFLPRLVPRASTARAGTATEP